MGFFSKLLDLLFGRRPPRPPQPTPTPGPVPVVRQLTSGRAVFRVSGVEGLRFGNGAGKLDNQVILTMLWSDGETAGPALELALRGVEDEAAAGRPVGGKIGLVARWSPNLSEDNRRYLEDKHRPESDYLGEGLKYPARLPLGHEEQDGSWRIEVRWNRSGVVIETPRGTATLQGRHPEAAGFGWWTPGVPGKGIGWGLPAFDAVKRGARVRLESWDAVGNQVPLVRVPPTD